MDHVALAPPAAFLPSPGEPAIPFTSWRRMFENFMLAVNDVTLSDVRKLALLIHCLGTEGQRLFYTSPVDESPCNGGRNRIGHDGSKSDYMRLVDVLFKM